MSQRNHAGVSDIVLCVLLLYISVPVLSSLETTVGLCRSVPALVLLSPILSCLCIPVSTRALSHYGMSTWLNTQDGRSPSLNT